MLFSVKNLNHSLISLFAVGLLFILFGTQTMAQSLASNGNNFKNPANKSTVEDHISSFNEPGIHDHIRLLHSYKKIPFYPAAKTQYNVSQHIQVNGPQTLSLLIEDSTFKADDKSSVSRFPQFWISGGLSGSSEGVGYTISSSYACSNQTIITARFMRYRSLALVYPAAPTTSRSFSNDPRSTEIAAMYGLMADGKYGQASLSGGIGWTMYSYQPPSPGIALEARASATAPMLGIGVKAFANISSRNNIWGIGAFLELGKLSIKDY